jgi:hypothetical protein
MLGSLIVSGLGYLLMNPGRKVKRRRKSSGKAKRNPSAGEAGAAYHREYPQHHFSRAYRYATEMGFDVQAFMDGWMKDWKPTPLSARTLASGKTKRNPGWGDQCGADHEAFLAHLNKGASKQWFKLERRAIVTPRRRRKAKPTKANPSREAVRRNYLSEAIELAEARAPLRQIVALTRAAARIRELTAAEIQRVVDARKIGHIRPNPRRRARRNPPRDPRFAGTFLKEHPPQPTSAYADGDTAVVESPYKAGTWEIWVFGMVDPRLGDNWNLVSKGHTKADAIREAMALAK